MLALRFQKSFTTKCLLPTRKINNKANIGRENFAKTIPNLFYIHNPLKYLLAQFQLARIRLLWDRQFQLNEFYRGTKQAASVMTDYIRQQDQKGIDNITTPIGFQQITTDMRLSKNDTRLQLLRFRSQDFHRAVPIKVILYKRGTNKNCFIDMLFVGMRNTRDFANVEERRQIVRTLDRLDIKMNNRNNNQSYQHRILFAEIFMRFFRNYNQKSPEDWSISFYKIVYFDVLNFI